MLSWTPSPDGVGHVIRGSNFLQFKPGPYGVYAHADNRKVAVVLVVSGPNNTTTDHWILFSAFDSPSLDTQGNSTHNLRVEACRPSACAPELAPFDDPSLYMSVEQFTTAMANLARTHNTRYTYLVATCSKAGMLG